MNREWAFVVDVRKPNDYFRLRFHSLWEIDINGCVSGANQIILKDYVSEPMCGIRIFNIGPCITGSISPFSGEEVQIVETILVVVENLKARRVHSVGEVP